MNIKVQPMGPYQTNCYIVTVNDKDFIIDPGVDATNWVVENTTNPVAILNTHGHFDHVWSNQELKEKLNLPIYCPKDDCFMLENDPFGQGTPKSEVDFMVEHDEVVKFDNINITFHHFAGHTPGCSAIEIDGSLFSGDFIFNGSIGRVDFPYSQPQDMIKSIHKVLSWDKDIDIYSGHGEPTTLKEEVNSLKNWLNYL
ncbi:MAG: MBL fold metallo-hydrolase [Campylobacterota bacterium]|nr:MBL fold metallo-hydrolase [Campylobacterota bacterium]